MLHLIWIWGLSFKKKNIVLLGKKIDENNHDEEILLADESFRVNYFLDVVEMTITSLKNRFEQLKSFERIFGFLFTSKKLKSLDGNDLRESCVNIHSTFSHGDLLDVDLDYFFFEFN